MFLFGVSFLDNISRSTINIYYNSNACSYSYNAKTSVFSILKIFFFSPVAVPTSFEGPFGKINYRVKAVIDTPRFSKDYKAQRPFYLLNLLNLNEVPDIEVSEESGECFVLTSQLWLRSLIVFYFFNDQSSIL